MSANLPWVVPGVEALRRKSARVSERVPPHAYFVVSAVFHYLGPAFAVLLFARVDVLGVAWLRIATAALAFALWRRPWRALAGLDAGGRRLLLAWGVVLAAMNACFYPRSTGCRSAPWRRSSSCPSSCSPRWGPGRRATPWRSCSRCSASGS